MIIVGGYTIELEADFSGTAFGGSPTWTDITVDLVGIGDDGSITGGRQQWTGSVTSTDISFTLDNAAGHYTPGLTTSPYYPHVVRNVRVRLFVTIAGVPCYLFDGYVNSWVASFESNVYGTCEVDASDMSARMSNSTAMRGFLTEEILLDNPLFLYPLQEDESATTFGDITAQLQPATIGNSKYGAGVVDAGQTPTGNFIAGNVVAVTNSSYATWNGTSPVAGSWLAIPGAPNLSSAFTVEFWVETPTTSSAYESVPLAFATSAGSVVCYFSTARFILNGTSTSPATSLPLDGGVHHVVGTVDGSGNMTLYIDGTAVAAGTGTLPGAVAVTAAAGLVPHGTSGSPVSPFTGGFAYIAAYPTALTSARIGAHYKAGANAFAGESTGAHFSRILGYRPNLGSVIDTTLGLVGSADIGNAPVVGDDGSSSGDNEQDDLQACADAEGGITYTDGQGRQVLRSRSRLFNPSSALTLDASKPQVDVSTTFAADMQNAVNDVTATRVNGAANRYYDPVAVNGPDGDLTSSVTVNVDTDQHALDIASWMVVTGKNTAPYSPNVVVNLLGETSSAVVAGVLQVAPFDVIMLTNLPAIAPASSVELMVQGWRYTIGQDAFTVEFYTSPMPPQVVEINGDAAHGINSTAIMAY